MTRFGKWILGLVTIAAALAVASPAFAQATDAAARASRDAWVAIAAGIGLGIAAFGGALGQGRMAAAAMDSIGRNPGASGKIFTPMLLGLAFIEAMVIYALIIAFILSGKIGT
jgi:F-type H+-transporting ATPase subunit c